VSASLHPALGLARAFALIVESMCRAIAVRAARDVVGRAALVVLWSRLRRLARRVGNVAQRVAEGRFDPRPRSPAPAGRARRGTAPSWPGGLRALARLAPETVCYGGQLRALLAEPEIAAMLAAAPRLARHVRPLCRLLGVEPPPPLPAPQRPAIQPPRVDRAPPAASSGRQDAPPAETSPSPKRA